MSTDLEVIAQLEQEIGVKLEERADIAYQNRDVIAEVNKGKKDFYVVDKSGFVTVLNISGNPFPKKFPQSIFSLTKLSHLDISNTGLKKILVGIAKLQDLRVLNLSDNDLPDLPPQMAQLQHLSHLHLNENKKLTDLPKTIINLPRLTTLSMRRCGITTLSSDIGQLKSLKNLYLNSNSLTILPPEIGLLSNLEKLDLSNNLLKELPQAFCKLSNTLQLEIKGNKNLNPQIRVAAEQGIKAICHYFKVTGEFSKHTSFINKGESNKRSVQKPLFSIEENKESAIGAKELAAELAELTIRTKNERGAMIGIFGQWGRGKTFLIEQIKNYFKAKPENPFHIIEFQAWRYQDTPATWAYLYEAFAKAYYENPAEHSSWGQKILNFPKQFKTWFRQERFTYTEYAFFYLLSLLTIILLFTQQPCSYLCIEAIFTIFGLISYALYRNPEKSIKYVENNIVMLIKTFYINKRKGGIIQIILHFLPQKKAIKLFHKYFSKSSFQELLGVQAEILEELKLLLEAWIPTIGDKRVLLIIDDIDRCPEDKIIGIIDALRIMLEDPEIYERVIVIAAIDEKILKRAVSLKYSYVYANDNCEDTNSELKALLTEYIDKLFLIGIKLNPLTQEERSEILDTYTKSKRIAVKSAQKEMPSNQSTAQDLPADKTENQTEYVYTIEAQGTDEPATKETGRQSRLTRLDLDTESTAEDAEKYEITDHEHGYLDKALQFMCHATPRKIRIFYYRYLLAKNLLPAQLDDETLDKFLSALPFLILKKSEYKTIEEMENEIKIEDGKINLYDQILEIMPSQYQILLKIIDIVVAY